MFLFLEWFPDVRTTLRMGLVLIKCLDMPPDTISLISSSSRNEPRDMNAGLFSECKFTKGQLILIGLLEAFGLLTNNHATWDEPNKRGEAFKFEPLLFAEWGQRNSFYISEMWLAEYIVSCEKVRKYSGNWHTTMFPFLILK